MKRVKIIYNPVSGRGSTEKRVNQVVKILLDRGYKVDKYATKSGGDGKKEAYQSAQSHFWDCIVAAGGDGTLNEITSGVYESGYSVPLAFLHEGTMNDLANHLCIDNTPVNFCNMLDAFYTKTIDLGRFNNQYFLNVLAGGLLTSVAHETPTNLKNALGRGAYYLQVIKEIASTGLTTFPLKIKWNGKEVYDSFNLFLVSNSPVVGGIENLMPLAQVQDGQLACIFIRDAQTIQEVTSLFFSVLKGEHLLHEKVLSFKTKHLTIETDIEQSIELDFDGEKGGNLPVEIDVIPSAIQVVVPKNKK